MRWSDEYFFNQIIRQVLVSIEGKPEIPPQPLQRCGILKDEQINDYLEDISDLRATIKGEWTKKLNEMMLKILKKDFKRRCTHERFIRMRHGTPLADAARSEAKKLQNMELNKLISEFFWGQANEMPKAEMEKNGKKSVI